MNWTSDRDVPQTRFWKFVELIFRQLRCLDKTVSDYRDGVRRREADEKYMQDLLSGRISSQVKRVRTNVLLGPSTVGANEEYWAAKQQYEEEQAAGTYTVGKSKFDYDDFLKNKLSKLYGK